MKPDLCLLRSTGASCFRNIDLTSELGIRAGADWPRVRKGTTCRQHHFVNKGLGAIQSEVAPEAPAAPERSMRLERATNSSALPGVTRIVLTMPELVLIAT